VRPCDPDGARRALAARGDPVTERATPAEALAPFEALGVRIER
jgi:hypothetical protein